MAEEEEKVFANQPILEDNASMVFDDPAAAATSSAFMAPVQLKLIPEAPFCIKPSIFQMTAAGMAGNQTDDQVIENARLNEEEKKKKEVD